MNDEKQKNVHKIHKVWQKTLGMESIELSKDYLAHGFHSVFIFQIIRQLNEMFGVSITMREFIENQSILKLASLVQEKSCVVNDSNGC